MPRWKSNSCSRTQYTSRWREKEKARAQWMATREVPWFARTPAGIGGCREFTKVRTTTTTTRGTWTKNSKSWFWQRWRRRGVNIRQKNQFIVYIVFARILIGCYALLCGSLLLLDCFGSIKGKTDNIKLVCIALF